ncbi:hypothetical protein KXW97_009540 [Aspergillus fumigatus]|nr:hypothetical protein KXW97_009540 [Aspergillus fumigatus]
MTVDPSTTNGRSESQEVSPLDLIPSLPLFLEAQKVSQHNAGKVAVIDAAKGEQFSYTQLLVDTAELKKTILEDLGLKDLEERRIAFLVPNGYDYVVIQWAIWAAGGVCVPLLPTKGTTHPVKELLYTIEDSDPSLVILHPAFDKVGKYSPSDHLIHVLPLHHVHGIINGLHPKFDPQVIWNRWQDQDSSTMFMAVPTIYSRLIDYFEANIRGTDKEAAARSGAKSLRLVVSGSAALPTPIKTKFAAITGQILLERYGMTEIGMALSCGLDVDKRIDGSVGWPLPGVQVRLVDKETGAIIETANEDGMIEIKGENVFLEYWRQPDATAREFTADGWFKTGDVARRDGSGAYFIQGRASVDLIKSGGYKISALEVERKMLGLDTIEEVAVVGLADEEWGQRVAAVVKQRPGTEPLDLLGLRAQLKQEMAPYKIPTVLKVVDCIERNAMGKVNKKIIVQKYWPDKA